MAFAATAVKGAASKAAAFTASSNSAGTPRAYKRAMAAASPTAVANAGGGLLLGAVSYVLVLTYLRGGSAGVKAWMRAKFLNDTTGSTR